MAAGGECRLRVELPHLASKIDVTGEKARGVFVGQVGSEDFAALHTQFDRSRMQAHHVINPYTHLPVPLTQGCAQVPSAQSVPNPVESRITLILKAFKRHKDDFHDAFLPHRNAAWRKSGKVFSACASTLFLLALLPLSAAHGETDAASQIDQAVTTHMQQMLTEEARRQAWQGQRHSLDITLLNSAERLPACTQALSVTVSSDDPSPLSRQRLDLSCADAPGWSVTALVQASVFLPAVHAARVIERGGFWVNGRGYRASDLPLVLAAGISSSVDAVVIMVLYIIEDAHQQSFIKNGDWLWALPPIIFMISSKIWVTCQRGELDDDPVVFVVKDRVCLAYAGLAGICFFFAWFGVPL